MIVHPKLQSLELTDSEKSILRLTALGYNTEEIAAELHLALRTVERKRQHVVDRFRAVSLPQLLIMVVKRGLLSLDELDVEP